jgi:sensor histidine kinase YesM
MQTRTLLYHALFWLFIFLYVLDYFLPYDALPVAILLTGTEVCFYLLFSYVNLFVLVPRIYAKHGTFAYLGALVGFLGICLLGYSLSGLESWLGNEESFSTKVSFVLNAIQFFLYSFMYWYYQKYRVEQQRALQLENEKLATEIESLKNQISPHFLFNSLNNIYALSSAKSDDAPKMVENLSEILRYLLNEGGKSRVALHQEVEMIEKYLEMQTLKKAKGAANIRFVVAGVGQQHQIIPLVLINFVENSFKHGDLQHNADGFIELNIKVTGDSRLHFTIRNSMLEQPSGDGIGLSNAAKQLELVYGDDAALIIDVKDGVFNVDLKVNV